MKIIFTGILAGALVLGALDTSVHPWVLLDRVIAVVNDSAIIESELEGKFNRLSKLKGIARNRAAFEKSRILDQLIENAILEQTARDESIIVSEKKVENHIRKIMDRIRLSNIDDFRKQVESREKMSFDEYKDELRISIIREQIIQIAIGISPPTKQEAMEWYQQNRSKVGYQVNIKHILIRPRNNTIAEEKRVNELMNGIRDRCLRGESFEALARQFSQDPGSASRGGDLSWVMLAELDPYFASQVFRMTGMGQISGVIKSGYGYHLVKFFGRRETPYEEIKDKIFELLFQQKMVVQFRKWVAKKRDESDVKIFMTDYVKG